MPAYVLVQANISDGEKYEVYKKLSAPAVERYGGRFLVRGGAREDLEGVLSVERVVILEFESMDRAREWYGSSEYQGARAAREGAATATFTLVEGA